jgi:hypothetical protein
MKYACLIYIEEKQLDPMSKNEWAPLGSEALAYNEEFRKREHRGAADQGARPAGAEAPRR